MNPVLIRHTFQRLLTRPVAAVVLTVYAVYVITVMGWETLDLQLNSVGTLNPQAGGLHWIETAQAAWALVWALGSGLLGQERSDGYLPLLLSRPVSRTQYVLSRWAGLVLSVVAIDGVFVTVALFWMASRHQAPDLGFILQRWAWFAYFTVLASAWLTLLSACFGGHGDLFYFFAASFAAYLAGIRMLGAAGFQKAHEILAWFWEPGDATFELVMGGNKSTAAGEALLFLLAALFCLALASYVTQRRDISYVNR